MKAVIFDLDGTLIESHEDVWDSIQLAFGFIGRGFPLSIRRDNSLLSLPATEILQMAYPDVSSEDTRRFLGELRRVYTEVCDHHKTYVYSGIESLLQQLYNGRIPLFIATMKSKLATDSVLHAKRMKHFFTEVFTPDFFPNRRVEKWEMLTWILQHYLLDANECIFVGDTTSDLKAANQVCIPAIGVVWGYGQSHELTAQNPAKLAYSVSELTNYLLSRVKSRS